MKTKIQHFSIFLTILLAVFLISAAFPQEAQAQEPVPPQPAAAVETGQETEGVLTNNPGYSPSSAGAPAPSAGAPIITEPALRAPVSYPACPATFPAGAFPVLSAGTHTLDTDALTLDGNPVANAQVVGGLAVFPFTSINIPAGVTLRGVGSRPMGLLSYGAVVINGTIQADGANATPTAPFCQAWTPSPAGAGGGAGGNGSAGPSSGNPGSGLGGGGTATGSSGGGGGGYGGGGGAGGSFSGVGGGGGGSYGNLAASLDGGSGGASGSTPISGCSNASGGGGGGGVLIYSIGSITIGATGIVSANGGSGAFSDTGASGGGSGGGVTLVGLSVTNSGTIRTNGASGGEGGCCGGGGGGAGGRILFSTFSVTAGTTQVNGGGASSGGAGGAAGSVGIVSSDLAASLYSCDTDLGVTITPAYTPKWGEPPMTAIAGEELVYNVTAYNYGPLLASGVSIEVVLPTPLIFLGDSLDVCVEGPTDTLTCALGDLDAFSTTSLAIKTRISSDAVQNEADGTLVVSASAEISAYNPDPWPENDIDTAEYFIQDVADLRITKYVEPSGTILAGTIFTYTIFVDNVGPSVARTVIITDTLLNSGSTNSLNPSLQIQSCAFSVSQGGGAITQFTCTTGNIVSTQFGSDVGTFKTNHLDVMGAYQGRLRASFRLVALHDITVTNIVRASSFTYDPNMGNNFAETFSSIEASADVSVDVTTAAPTTIDAGEMACWDVTVTNNGPSRAENVLVSFVLPEAIVDGSLTTNISGCMYGTPGSPSDPAVCNLGTMATTTSLTVQVCGDVDPAFVLNQPDSPAADFIDLDAYVTSDTFDRDMADNYSTAYVEVTESADLRLQKFLVGTPTAGAIVHYEYQITNLGPSFSEDVTLRDFLPSKFEFISAYVDYENGQGFTPLACTLTLGSNVLFCPLGDIPLTGSQPIMVFVNGRIKPDATGSITNSADLNLRDTPDPNTANNSATTTTPLRYNADVDIIKTATPTKVVAGEQVKYTVTVINNGPSSVYNVVVTDPLTDTLTYEVSNGDCDLLAGVLTCNLGGLAPGESVTFDYWALLDDATPQGSTVTNTACAAWMLGDATTFRACDSADVFVLGEADLRVTKFVEPFEDIPAGKIFTYTIWVDNLGPSTAWNVVISDTLLSSNRVTIQSCAFSVSQGGGAITQFTCTTGELVSTQFGTDIGTFKTNLLDPIGSGQGRLRASFRLVAKDAINVTNTTRVSSDTHDPNQDNNMAVTFSSVYGVADLALSSIFGAERHLDGLAGNIFDSNLFTPMPDPACCNFGGTNVTAGRRIEWTATVFNNGPSRAYNSRIEVYLPYGTTLIENTLLTNSNPGFVPGRCYTELAGELRNKVICEFGTLLIGQQASLSLQVLVDPNLPDGMQLSFDSKAFSDTFEPDMRNNSTSIQFDVDTWADIAVEKSAYGQNVVGWDAINQEYIYQDIENLVTAGLMVRYQITVTNEGPSLAKNVQILENLTPWNNPYDADPYSGPGITEFLFAEGAECLPTSVSMNVLTCVLGDLAAGERKTFYVYARVLDSTAEMAIPEPNDDDNTKLIPANMASVITMTEKARVLPITEDPYDPNNMAYAGLGVRRVSDLGILKTVSTLTPVAGTQFSYEITVWNDGPSSAQDVTVTDLLPVGVTYLFDTAGCGEAALAAGCNLGNFGVGQTFTFKVVVQLDADVLPGTVLNNLILVENSGYETDFHTSNNYDTTEAYVNTVADLRLMKFGKPDGEVQAGELLSYTLVVDNLGPSFAHQVVITDLLVADGQFDLVSIDPDVLGNRPNAVCAPVAPIKNINQRLTVTCELGEDLEPFGPEYGSGRWMVEIVVKAADPIDLNNYASVSSLDYDPDPYNNTMLVSHEITAVADLAVTKDDDHDPVTAGTQFVYEFVVTNNGPSSADNVVFKDLLPLGVHLISFEIDLADGVCVSTQDVPGNLGIQCAFGTLLSEESVAFSVTLMADASLLDGTLLYNQAMVYSDQFDTFNANNLAVEATTIAAFSEVGVDKKDSVDPVTAGEVLYVQVVLWNQGPSVVKDLSLADTIPAGLTFLGYEIGNGTAACLTDMVNQTVDCNLGDLAVGDWREVNLAFAVSPDLPDGTVLYDKVSVWADSPITTFGDFEEETTVVNASQVEITKLALDASPVAGGDQTWRVTVKNTGASTAFDVVVEDALPAGTSFVYVNKNSCVFTAGTLTCDFGDMQPGGWATFDLVARLDPAFACGTSLENTALVSWDIDGDATADLDNSATAVTPVDCLADLRVVKFGKPDGEVYAGEFLTYTIVVDNLGPSFAPTVVLLEELISDGMFDLVSVNPDLLGNQPGAACTPTGPMTDVDQRLTISCDLAGQLEIFGGEDGPGRWMVEIVVQATEQQSLNNLATVSSGIPDPDEANNQAVAQHQINASADLQIVKTDSADPVLAGTTFSYQLVITNAGVSTAEGVMVKDILPLGLDVIGLEVTPVVGTCALTQEYTVNPVVECSLGTLAVGAVVNIEITVAVHADVLDGSILFNQASVESQNYDPDLSNNLAVQQTAVEAEAALTVTKTDAPDPVLAGNILTYKVSVSNAGPSMAQGVSFVDTLPAAVQFLAAGLSDPTGTCVLNAGTVTCELGDLLPGASEQVVMTVMVSPDLADGTQLLNNVTWSAASPAQFSGDMSETTSVSNASAIAVTKLALDPSPLAGGDQGWHITIANTGPSTAFDVILTDELADGTSFIYASHNACQFAAGTLTCDFGDLGPGEGAEFDLFARIDPSFTCGADLVNTALVTWDDGDVSATATTPVDCAADLRVSKFGKPDGEVAAGELLTYTIVVDNLGPSDAHDVTLVEVLASDGTFDIVAVDTGGGTCDIDLPLTVTNDLTFDCAFATLEPFGPDSTGRWTVQLVVMATAPQDLNNLATVTSSVFDPDESNNQAITSHQFTSSADLEIVKTDSADPVVAGESFSYELVVTNLGVSKAEGVFVQDVLPLGLEVTALTVAPVGTCGLTQGTAGNPVVECNLGSLLAGASVTIQIAVATSPDLPDGATLFNQATVESMNYDPDLSNNLAFQATGITAESVLAVTKTDGPDPVVAGEELSYVLTVLNEGPSLARGVSFVDTLPAGMTFLSAEMSTGACVNNAGAGQVICHLGDMAPGASVEVVIRVAVSPDLASGAVLTNNAAWSAESPAQFTGGMSATTAVLNASSLEVTKLALGDALAGGEQAWRITVVNTGPSTAFDAVLEDELADGAAFLYAAGQACTASGGVITCDLGDLSPAETITFDLFAQIDPAFACDTNLVNTAVVSWNRSGADTVEASATATTPVACAADLRVSKFGKPDGEVAAGEILTYTIIVDNLGPSTAHDVTLVEHLASSGSFDLVAINAGGGTCDVTAPLTVNFDLSFTCTLDSLVPFGPARVPGRWIVQVAVMAVAPQDLNNLATVTSSVFDPDQGNNQATTAHEITDSANLELVKSAAPNPAIAGQNLVYTLVVTNHGPSVAEKVILVEQLPGNLAVQSINVTGGGTCVAGTPITCSFGNMADGATRTVQITVRVPANVPTGAVLNNSAYVTAESYDKDYANNYAGTLTPVQAVADLVLTKTTSDPIALPGQPVDFTITVKNLGPSDVFGAKVTDLVPAEITGVTWSCQLYVGKCTPSGSGAIVDYIDLPAGMELVYHANGIMTTVHDVVNTASVSMPVGVTDPNLTNNSGSVTFTAFRLYLPLIFGPVDVRGIGPDLVVKEIAFLEEGISVTIENTGLLPVTSPFWVDVYVRPIAAIEQNKTWWVVAQEGLVWGIPTTVLPLDPGESLVLTVGDAYFWPSLSTWPLTFQDGDIYAQVDSFGFQSYGAVEESHEMVGGPYNNIYGPVDLAPFVLRQGPGWFLAPRPLFGLPVR